MASTGCRHTRAEAFLLLRPAMAFSLRTIMVGFSFPTNGGLSWLPVLKAYQQ